MLPIIFITSELISSVLRAARAQSWVQHIYPLSKICLCTRAEDVYSLFNTRAPYNPACSTDVEKRQARIASLALSLSRRAERAQPCPPSRHVQVLHEGMHLRLRLKVPHLARHGLINNKESAENHAYFSRRTAFDPHTSRVPAHHLS